MPFKRHRLEALGHVGFVDPVEMDRSGRLFEYQVDHLPQIGTRRIPEVRQQMTGAAWQAEQGCSVRIGLDIGRYRLFTQAHHFITLRVELERLGTVVVGNQQITTAFHQAQYGVMYVQCNQAALDRAELFAQAGHPSRKKSKCQRVWHRELDHVLRG